MDNRLDQISRRVTTKYREVTGDPFNAASDDLEYLFSVIDANYNAGLEAAASKCEDLVTFTEEHKCTCEPCAWCEALETAATAIRALSVK